MQPYDPTGLYPTDEVLAALQGLEGTRDLDFRFERLDANNVVLGEMTSVVSASVANNNLADIKRTAKFVISDDEPVDYLSDRIKPYCRVAMPPRYAWVPQGPPRVNLIPNPSFETSTTGWSAEAGLVLGTATSSSVSGTKVLTVTGNNTVPGYTRTNIHPNPSFEVNTTTWSVGSGCTIARSTAQALVGTASLAVTFTTTSGSVRPTTSTGTSALPVSANTGYGISVATKAGSVARAVNVFAYFYDAAGASLTSVTVVSGQTNSTSAWTTHTGYLVTPPLTAYMSFLISLPTTAAAEVHYIDAMMVEALGTLGSTNMLPNPGFETDISGWVVTNGAPTLAQTTAQFQAGAASLEVTGTSTAVVGVRGLSGLNAIPVTAGQVYSASAWFRSATTSRTAFVFLEFYTAVGASLGNTTSVTGTTTTTSWLQLRAAAAAPPTAAFVRVALQWSTPTAGDVQYVDSITLESLPIPTGAYFDGASTSGGGVTYAWTGTASNSSSTAIVATAPTSTTNAAALGPSVSATPGAAYTGSAYVRDPSVARTATLEFGWYDATSTLISKTEIGAVTTTTGWQRMLGSAVAPALTATVRLQVRWDSIGSGQATFVDAVLLERRRDPIPVTLEVDTFLSGDEEGWDWVSVPPATGTQGVSANSGPRLNFWANNTPPLQIAVHKVINGFEAGKEYTVTASLAAWVAGSANSVVLAVVGHGSTTPVNLAAAVYQVVSYTFVAHEVSYDIRITAQGSPSNVSTDVLMDGFSVRQTDSALTNFFDGDSTDVQTESYSWTGTPHASLSEAQGIGYAIDTTERGYVEWPLGVFLLTSPKRAMRQGDQITRDVEAYDQLLVLTDNVVSDRYEVAAGVVYTTAVTNLLTGIPVRNVTPTTKTLPVAMSWEPGTAYLRIINDLLAAINYEAAWFDENGVFIARPYQSPAERPPEYTYATDETSVITGQVDQSLDLYGVANKWVLVVSDPDRAAIVGTYTNTSASSPTSTVNRGRTIVDFRTEQDAADSASLTAKAARLAFEASQVYENVEFTTAVMPIHSNNDVYGITVDEMGVLAKYSEHSWEMPLAAGATMKHSARRIINLGA